MWFDNLVNASAAERKISILKRIENGFEITLPW